MNVFGDCVGVAVIQRVSSKQLSSAPPAAPVAIATSSSISTSSSSCDDNKPGDLNIKPDSHSPTNVKQHAESTDL